MLMPDMAGHVAYIGFRQESAAGCDKHNPDYDICYVSVDGWSVAPIGKPTLSIPRIPHGVLNLTRGSGNVKVDTTQVRNQIRSQISFLSGMVTDSCGLAKWTFDPYGSPLPEELRLINVLEWQIPNLQQETLDLVLHWRGPNTKPDKRITLHANDSREIELLILHVTEEEGVPFTEPERLSPAGPGTHPATLAAEDARPEAAAAQATPVGDKYRSQAVRRHFNGMYDLLGAQSNRRRMPTRPVRTREVCPITILDLEDFYEGVQRGVRTYSCVMASAEPA